MNQRDVPRKRDPLPIESVNRKRGASRIENASNGVKMEISE